LTGGAEENQKGLNQDSRCPDRFKPDTSRIEVEALPPEAARMVRINKETCLEVNTKEINVQNCEETKILNEELMS
jgi:hypothetical protein